MLPSCMVCDAVAVLIPEYIEKPTVAMRNTSLATLVLVHSSAMSDCGGWNGSMEELIETPDNYSTPLDRKLSLPLGIGPANNPLATVARFY